MIRLRVRDIAVAQKMNMSQLSRTADVAYRTVVRVWKNPQHDITMSTLVKLAKALRVKVVDLIEETEGENQE